MNLDFHYYGTYYAAVTAGFDRKEAELIAYAAQFVDESSIDRLEDALGTVISNFDPVPTTQSQSELVKKNMCWPSDEDILKISDVWIPFHFLPGNFGDTALKYTGPNIDNGILEGWTFGEDSKKQFKLMCLPNSILVEGMVNDLIENHSNEPKLKLLLTGIRMHVLADTWAHKYFAGYPAWFINNVGSVKDNNEKEIKWKRLWPWVDSVNFVRGGEFATPDMLSYSSLAYLGHGRIGHLPDCPWAEYRYQPQWLSAWVAKDNPKDFLFAFEQMVWALKCIKENKVFVLSQCERLSPELENKIEKNILSFHYDSGDQSERWISEMGNLAPERFHLNKWKEEVSKSENKEATNYFIFNKAARIHREYVNQALKDNNINIFDDQPKYTVTTKFKNLNGKHISTRYERVGPFGQYYPKISESPIQLELIKETDSPLKDGDIVEIRTNEEDLKEYRYLGAWSFDFYLYYYKRDSSNTKQKWMIEKVDPFVSNLITDGDRVRFKNLYFKEKPYLSTCECKSFIAGNGTYLTTQTNNDGNEVTWILDGLTQTKANSTKAVI